MRAGGAQLKPFSVLLHTVDDYICERLRLQCACASVLPGFLRIRRNRNFEIHKKSLMEQRVSRRKHTRHDAVHTVIPGITLFDLESRESKLKKNKRIKNRRTTSVSMDCLSVCI